MTEHETTATLQPSGAPVKVRMTWHPLDPHAVKLRFQTAKDKWTDWILDRELLADGLNGCAGRGDVHIRVHEKYAHLVVVDLSTPVGKASFHFRGTDLEGFLTETWDVVEEREASQRYGEKWNPWPEFERYVKS